MTQQQFEKRKERAENEILVISRTDEGFRVYSPAYPTNSYIVSGSSETPNCTCPDFQHHEGDPQWRCKHILAVLNRVSRPAARQEASDQYDAEERQAIQTEAPPPAKMEVPPIINGASQMVIKRSVSPDGRIDSLSVEFSCPVNGAPVKEIKSRALRTLRLQADIVGSFLNGKKPGSGQRNAQEGHANGAVPAQMLSIGGMDGKWGRRLFINVQANGRVLRLFGNAKKLTEYLAAAGFLHLTRDIAEGVQLNLPCRVTTRPSEDGKYLNIERVLPTELPRPQRRLRQ